MIYLWRGAIMLQKGYKGVDEGLGLALDRNQPVSTTHDYAIIRLRIEHELEIEQHRDDYNSSLRRDRKQCIHVVVDLLLEAWRRCC